MSRLDAHIFQIFLSTRLCSAIFPKVPVLVQINTYPPGYQLQYRCLPWSVGNSRRVCLLSIMAQEEPQAQHRGNDFKTNMEASCGLRLRKDLLQETSG